MSKNITKIVKIKFKTNGKVYDFNSGAFILEPGDSVIVETGKGLGFGTVCSTPITLDNKKSDKELKKIFKKADKNDLKQLDINIGIEKKAHLYCTNCINRLGLKMNLFSVESTFDSARLTFFFTADGRIDFRELVKVLVKKFRARIEMRQVGIRNQAKMCGGMGRCGQILCCASFLNKFEPVSIKMAKRQGLSLNPTKISGQCGRLMCCLTFEDSIYKEAKAKLPKLGKIISTKTTKGKVTRHNITNNSITIRTIEGKEQDIDISEIINSRRYA